MKKMVLGKFPPGEFPPEKFPPIKLPLENSLPHRKIATQKILTWNIPIHFINCLSSLNTLFWLQHFQNIKLQNRLLSNSNDNSNNNEKKN